MRSCIFALYVAGAAGAARCHIGVGCANRAAGSRRRSRRALSRSRDTSRARRRPPRSGRRASPPTRGTSTRRASSRRRATGSAPTACRSRSARPRSKPASPRRAAAIALNAEPARRTLLARRQHGRAGRIVRPAAGHQVSRADQGRAADDAEARSGVPRRLRRSRARPLVFQGAGTVRRQQQAIGSAPAQVADLQPATASSRTCSSPRRWPTWDARTRRARNARRRSTRRSIRTGRRRIAASRKPRSACFAISSADPLEFPVPGSRLPTPGVTSVRSRRSPCRTSCRDGPPAPSASAAAAARSAARGTRRT